MLPPMLNYQSLTPVHTAAINRNAEAIKALLELGASPNYKDSMGLTPLFHLCKKKNSPALCAELLLSDYARLEVKDEQGNTELHQACKIGNYKLRCLQTLLVRGADKSVTNNAKQTAYDVANISSHKDAANILSKHDALLIVMDLSSLDHVILSSRTSKTDSMIRSDLGHLGESSFTLQS
ncbi:SHANK3 [Bugula neritina]|uniref:SHANK3 n=1 Tax=Bugula neritina TaxID=10212 RepID=A0A7J7J6Q7_BUGNE|nr:SHANK3 [Bugula neritina]